MKPAVPLENHPPNKNCLTGSLLKLILSDPPARKLIFHLREHPIPNDLMAVILNIIINIKRVNIVINQQAKIVVEIRANHRVVVTQQVRFAFILIEMSHQLVNCQTIYAVIVVRGCKHLNHPPQVVPAAPELSQVGRQSHVHVVAHPAPSSPSVNGTDLSVAGEIKQMLTDIKSELHSDIQSLTTRMDKLEALPQPASTSKPQSTQDYLRHLHLAIQLLPAVPSNLQISDLDLPTKTSCGLVLLQQIFHSLYL